MNEIKLYEITADYRPNNPNKPHYYVRAKNKPEATSKFCNKLCWLKIYQIKECDEYIAKQVIANPDHYIIF